jgi:A-factor type gamma-butyrolactone 1'-reductase (1S-forming)
MPDVPDERLYPELVTSTSDRLKGRTIVVFGASSGIGAAAVERFTAEGATVVAAARRLDKLEELASQLGDAVVPHRCDVNVEDDVEAVVASTLDRFGRLDGAFNNAGVSGTARPMHDLVGDELRAVIETNVVAVAMCMKHELRAMREQGGGSIVNTSSVGGLRGNAMLPSYGMTKAAVDHMTKSAARAYGERGIRVNSIAPGPTSSEMLDPWIADRDARLAWASSPLGFIALADDMARAAAFLLSDDARWISGVVLPIEGAASA